MLSPKEAIAWKIAAFDDDAYEWVLAFGTNGSAEALAWTNAGWDDGYDASLWAQYVAPEEARAWREKLDDPEEAKELRDSGLTPEELTADEVSST